LRGRENVGLKLVPFDGGRRYEHDYFHPLDGSRFDFKHDTPTGSRWLAGLQALISKRH